MMLALYHNDMSSCAQKVRLCLWPKRNWSGEPSYKDDLRAGEHQQEWYIKLNRRAVVPTLIHDDVAVQNLTS